MGFWGKGWGNSSCCTVHPIPSPQERFQVKNPPTAYVQKLRSYLDTGGVSRKAAPDWMSHLGVCVPPFPLALPPAAPSKLWAVRVTV